MIDSELETIKRVYRIRRLLVSHDAAVESTVQLCAGFRVNREQILEIASAEDRRRAELVQAAWSAAQDLEK
jgi:hypothetical protein